MGKSTADGCDAHQYQGLVGLPIDGCHPIPQQAGGQRRGRHDERDRLDTTDHLGQRQRSNHQRLLRLSTP